jgi:NodT family efflux transporter outer membrane factor (OMF) lipoprotein
MSPLNSRPRLAAALAALLLSACTTVGPNFTRPAAPPTPGYAMAGDPSAPRVALGAEQRAAGPWWNALGSPDLDRAIRQALAGSPTLAEANATLERVQQEEASVRGARQPEATYNAGAQHERINTSAFGFTGFPSPTISLYSVGAGVSYDLDLFGGGRRQVEAAQAQVERQARTADAAYLTLTGNVALQAARIATLRAQIATIQSVVADDRRLLEMIHAGQRAGGTPASATSGGETQLAQDLALIPPLERQLSEARHQMALLVGRAPADWTAPDFDLASFTLPGSIPVELPSALVRQRPDIEAAEAELHMATARIGVARAAEFPDIRLSASLTQTALNPGNLFSYSASGWNLAAGLTGPIFNGGRLRANRRAAEAEARASLARYQGTVLRSFVQVADALSDLAHDDEVLAAYRRADAAAESNLRDAQTAYRLGGGTLLQVVDAQRQVNQERRNLAIAQGQRLSDIVTLYTATAADWRG